MYMYVINDGGNSAGKDIYPHFIDKKTEIQSSYLASHW